MLSRAALRATAAEKSRTSQEDHFIQSIATRVRLWREIGPYYSDKGSGPNKTNQARGSESVINALILANEDAASGGLSEVTRLAFDHMWGEQQRTGELNGAWLWLDFGLKPWESFESAYYGAALAALAVGMAPESYRSNPSIGEQRERLRAYIVREYQAQSLLNRLFGLWASSAWPELLDRDRQQALIAEILSQQRDDGGWSTASLARTNASVLRSWIRKDGTILDRDSDGVATGLVVFVLRRSGVPQNHASIHRGLAWLKQHQYSGGFWYASSLNKRRAPSSDIGRFMTDAATSYAVLALAQSAPD